MNVFMQRNICMEHTIHVAGQPKVSVGQKVPYTCKWNTCKNNKINKQHFI